VARSVQSAVKKIVPLFDRVLIEKAEAITKTKGGLYIPEKAQGKVVTGKVIAVGPGGRNEVRVYNKLIP
jgi:chaperonin GroES